MAGVLGRAFIQVFADLSKFTPGLRQEIKKALDEQTKGLRFEELDKSAEKAGEQAADKLAEGVDHKIENDMKREGKKGGLSLGKALGTAFSVAAASFLPTIIALAVELVAALAPAATALAATIPAAIATAVASAVVLKMAFNGVGAALKTAFDPSKAAQFNEAMKKLSPAARSFVMEIKNLHPLFHQLQQDVQQAFFVQLKGGLTQMTRNLLPALHAGLTTIATDLGKLGRNLMNTLGSRRADFASIFIMAHEAIKPFIPALAKVAGSFVTIAAVAGPMVAALSGGFAHLLTEFSTFIEKAANSGSLAKFFDDALVILHQLGQFLGVVFRLVNDIVGVLQTTGAQSLGILTQLVGQIDAFLQTAEGRQMLVSLFNLLNVALHSLNTILVPLLPAIGKLVSDLSGGLTTGLEKITPLLAKVTDFLGKHPQLLEAAAAAWGIYRIALMAVALWEGIVDALNPVGLIILAVAAIAAGAVLIWKNWSVVSHAFGIAWKAVSDFFVGVWRWIVTAGKDIANWFGVTLPNFFLSIPGKIWAALSALPGLLVRLFFDALHAAGEVIGIEIGLFLAYFVKLPSMIWFELRTIGHLFVDLWNLAFATGKSVLEAGVAAVVFIFTQLPLKIGLFVMRLPGIIAGAFRSALDWARREVISGANFIVDFVSKLPGRISGFFNNVGHAILGGLKAGINAVISGFNSGIDKVSGLIHIGLPHIPMLAAGGVIKAPTLAVVGEAGPEAVIPLSNPDKAARVAQKSGLLDILGSRMGNVGTTLVKVYLGTREITDILDTRITHALDGQANELAYGTRG